MFSCPECKTVLPPARKNGEGLLVCPECGHRFLVELFPALAAKEEAAAAQSVLHKGESSCFYHPDKIAAQACDHCGRFLCALCRIPVRSHNLCPTCMAKGKDPGATVAILESHTMHDAIVLSAAAFSFFVMPLSLVIAPIILFLIWKNYRKGLGLVPRWRWRYWLAGALATAQLAGWSFFFISLLQ